MSLRIRANSGISEKYPRAFLKSIRNYGLPCPICGKGMISLDIFYLPAETSLKYLLPYAPKMTSVNRRVFYRLLAESKKYPNLSVNELLTQMAPQAERAVDIRRIKMLNELSKDVFKLPGEQKKQLRDICNRFQKILRDNEPDKKHFNGYFDDAMRKFMRAISNNQELYEHYCKVCGIMPRVGNDENAAILEFAKRGNINAIMDIYSDPFAVLGHIKPYRDGGDIAIWECNRDNSLIKTFPLHLIAKEAPFTIENMKAHVARLVQIYKETIGKESKAFSDLLKEYILDVEKDIRIESKNAILPDISELFK